MWVVGARLLLLLLWPRGGGEKRGNGWRRSVRSVSERAVCNNEEQTDLEPRKEVFAAMHNT